MENEFGSDYITVTDEDGNEIELELIETLPLGSELYMAFLLADNSDGNGEMVDIDADEEDGLIIMKVIHDENGEELFATLDDDQELEYVYEKFMEVLFDDEEEDDAEDDDLN